MLKGVCCLLVVYVHFVGSHTNVLQDAIGSFAYIAVTLFFMTSAYGMMLNAERKNDYLKTFWRNRLLALLVPWACVNIVAFLLNIVKKRFWMECPILHQSICRSPTAVLRLVLYSGIQHAEMVSKTQVAWRRNINIWSCHFKPVFLL